MTTTDPRYVGTINVAAYPDGRGGYLADAVRTIGYLGEGGAILDDDQRLDALRFATGDDARAAVASAQPGAIPGAARLREREVRA